jgi:hypothetical protein
LDIGERRGRTGSLLNRAGPTPYSEVNFLSGVDPLIQTRR